MENMRNKWHEIVGNTPERLTNRLIGVRVVPAVFPVGAKYMIQISMS